MQGKFWFWCSCVKYFPHRHPNQKALTIPSYWSLSLNQLFLRVLSMLSLKGSCLRYYMQKRLGILVTTDRPFNHNVVIHASHKRPGEITARARTRCGRGISHLASLYASINNNTYFQTNKILEKMLTWMHTWTIDIIWDCPRRIETYGRLKDKILLSCFKQKFNCGEE